MKFAHYPGSDGLVIPTQRVENKPQHNWRNWNEVVSMTVEQLTQLPDNYKFGWHDDNASVNVKKKGLSEAVVTEISQVYKSEPEWMLKRRLKALRHFESRSMPTWGADLTPIDFQDIYYYVLASDKSAKSWDDVPTYVKDTFDKLGIPEAEQKFLAGAGAQYDS